MDKKTQENVDKGVEKGMKIVKGSETPKTKKPTKAEKIETERIAREAQEAHQEKQMDEQIKAMSKGVKDSICNQCDHCTNRNKAFDRFKAKSSTGEKQLFVPMNFCGLAGLSMVDIVECEMFNEVEKK